MIKKMCIEKLKEKLIYISTGIFMFLVFLCFTSLIHYVPILIKTFIEQSVVKKILIVLFLGIGLISLLAQIITFFVAQTLLLLSFLKEVRFKKLYKNSLNIWVCLYVFYVLAFLVSTYIVNWNTYFVGLRYLHIVFSSYGPLLFWITIIRWIHCFIKVGLLRKKG